MDIRNYKNIYMKYRFRSYLYAVKTLCKICMKHRLQRSVVSDSEGFTAGEMPVNNRCWAGSGPT
jgi:hypothetical protein